MKVNKGFDELLFNAEPPVMFIIRLPIVNVLALSLKSGLARFMVAGPGVPGLLPVVLSVTFRKLLVRVNVFGLELFGLD